MMNAKGMSKHKLKSKLIEVFLEFVRQDILLCFTNIIIKTVSGNTAIFITRMLRVSTHKSHHKARILYINARSAYQVYT